MGNMAADRQDTGRMMSKTQHYRKVTKPLLERKRRARMNHYLDELKDLIIETMEAQGEHITKLEKADILEMTVTYLRTKNQNKSKEYIKTKLDGDDELPPMNAEKFRAGYTQAAYEVSKVFASIPGIDVHFGTKLMKHLGYKLKDLPVDTSSPSTSQTIANQLLVVTPNQSPELPSSVIRNDKSDVDNNLHQDKVHHDNQHDTNNDVWRPW